ncbi:hypothetical protein GobsT_44850 [Gemmata obscuriglobus]|uniref:DUF6798 domain-containing protein n=1 Tax=Gemmata obscuriglobus TaxID=114 RepID=A0A2Z3GY08_9BACT|nr:DUF6798 domain-containing protein [Gemmata obscuriglobus]AWM37531.1 hypothetical protein C1280_11245 [Gemmata obscuriglobus]QEG29687.1 hypothetical protein GobsT_44850 [Gemmata obscuriglobus]VTS09004.1 Uncharacterized protein OS=Chroococcidiopsis thermalis PCC 7203 GN=Chro_5070 PE=4 SV=1 [Gemmata obscuriglobus UQM 2246]
MHESTSGSRILTVEAVLLALAFAISHTQSPLYYSNQNQYLLHAAASAHYGHLAGDWLANTADPTPLFSLLTSGAFATQPWLIQPVYFALLASYFLAVRWLVVTLPWFPNSWLARLGFAALFTAAHAGILRWLSIQAVGVDYPWYLQSGLAAQYLLGPGFQPSAFGVLLVWALALFAHGKPRLACAVAAAACWFHSTYLFPSGLLVAGFVCTLAPTRARAAVQAGGGALVVVAPVFLFTFSQFDPLNAGAENALSTLANVRIPHHCVPARWLDRVAGCQLAWVVFGLVLARRVPFGRALTTAAAGGVLFTGVQLATRSDALALTFPWRISVLLVPIATAIICSAVASRFSNNRQAERVAFALLVTLVAGGVAVTALGLGYRTVDESGVYNFVRGTAKPEDVYLIPTSFPKVGSGRGAVSNTFAPPPRAKEGTNQIPVDLQRFRLATGACVYVDFKSVPYAASEVQEWHSRMTFAADFYSNQSRNFLSDHTALRMRGITHVVASRSQPFEAHYLEEVYADDAYIVYRVE